MYVILVYDIQLDDIGNKVLRNVFKTCKKYLHHIQNSVFEGGLSDSEYMKLRDELFDILRHDIDSCIIFKSRHERWLEKEFLTDERLDKTSNFI